MRIGTSGFMMYFIMIILAVGGPTAVGVLLMHQRDLNSEIAALEMQLYEAESAIAYLQKENAACSTELAATDGEIATIRETNNSCQMQRDDAKLKLADALDEAAICRRELQDTNTRFSDLQRVYNEDRQLNLTFNRPAASKIAAKAQQGENSPALFYATITAGVGAVGALLLAMISTGYWLATR